MIPLLEVEKELAKERMSLGSKSGSNGPILEISS